MTRQPLARPGISLRRVGTATAGWGVVFAIVHFYWAAGGSVGTQGGAASSLAASFYIAFIAVLGLLGAAVAHGLSHEWGESVGPRRLALLARAGGVALLTGVTFGVGKWVVTASIGDDGAAGVVITLYFLIGGLLFCTLGWWGEAGDS